MRSLTASDIAATERPVESLDLNDAQDRGYLIWSAGWTGSAPRLIKEDQQWTAISLMKWITRLGVQRDHAGGGSRAEQSQAE